LADSLILADYIIYPERETMLKEVFLSINVIGGTKHISAPCSKLVCPGQYLENAANMFTVTLLGSRFKSLTEHQ
jgi:hypothetical protein